MVQFAASVVIVSHKRPMELERAVASLAYQSLTNFEIIVVADRPPLVHHAVAAPVRYLEFAEANISRARNQGVKRSKAPIVAFCDDDCVPDPYWLERLIAPFYEERQVAATGGYVRGRNGISYQWKGVGFLQNGEDIALDVDESKPWHVFRPSKDFYVKTVGTNCAFRVNKLREIRGFDEGFHYYLDDTDINLRLQDAGYSTAIVPGAQVIHNFAQSRGRSHARIPQSLYDLGSSTNLFLRKHLPAELEINLRRFYQDQEQRLKEYFYYGRITKKQKNKLLRDLNNGLVSGAVRRSKTPLKPATQKRLVKRETRNSCPRF